MSKSSLILWSKIYELEIKIKNFNDKIIDPSQIKVSKEEFLNTFKSAPDKIRADSAIEKDRVCRILFLNLRIDNEKVTSYLWREPFRSLVTFIENSAGALEALSFEHLLSWLDQFVKAFEPDSQNPMKNAKL